MMTQEKVYSEAELEEFFRHVPPEKRWENLTLANDFLFGKIFSQVKAFSEMIRRILPDVIKSGMRFVEVQKSVKTDIDTRGVRFDIYAEGDDKKLYDVEIQTTNQKDLSRRSRAYHIAMGDKVLKKNIKQGRSYNDLPDAYVIFICTFDPFGEGRHIYTFKNFCAEDKNLALNDGGTTIFLNTYGKRDDISQDLKALLNCLLGIESEDPYIKYLMGQVKMLKQNPDWRHEFMISEMERIARINEGKDIGRHQMQIENIINMRAMGMSDDLIMRALRVSPEYMLWASESVNNG